MGTADPQGLQAFPDELSAREAWLEPFDWYRRMREEAPVRYDPARETWDVFRYADVRRVLEDDETFSVDLRQSNSYQPPERPEEELIFETMLFQDPPRHDELRGVVEDAFRPSELAGLEGRIREIADELVADAVAGDGPIEFVADVAYPLPVIVIAELLGVPADDRDRFKRWSDALVASSAGDSGEALVEEYQQSQYEMAAYFLEALEDRRANPREDLLTTIATAERADGSRLSQEEALGTCILLLVAGNITTTNLLANAVRSFLDAGIDDPREGAGLPAAIEEVLRYRSPVQAMSRVATTDVRLGGAEIETGDGVIAWMGSANRDERQFPDPDTFVHDRNPTGHLGFGHGTHYCLGAPLARLEARVTLGAFYDRVEGVELAETSLEPTRSSFVYGVESLPLRVDRIHETT